MRARAARAGGGAPLAPVCGAGARPAKCAAAADTTTRARGERAARLPAGALTPARPAAPPPRAGGAVTIVFEMSGGHFMEFLKIAKQTSTES